MHNFLFKATKIFLETSSFIRRTKSFYAINQQATAQKIVRFVRDPKKKIALLVNCSSMIITVLILVHVQSLCTTKLHTTTKTKVKL